MSSLQEYLEKLKSSYADSNLYSQLGSSFMKQDLPQGRSLGESLTASIVKGLLSGGLIGYGNFKNQEYGRSAADVLSNTMSGRESTNFADLSDSDFAELESSASLFRDSKEREIRDERDMQAAKTEGQLEGQAKGLESFYSKNKSEKSDFEDTGGRETLDQKRKHYVAEARSLGVTPGDWNEYANSAIKNEKDEAARALKDLEERGKKLGSLEDTIRTSEEGIRKSGGNTGPDVISRLSRGKDYFLSAIPGIGDAADERLAGYSLLDQVAQKGVGLNKIPGLGGMSDFESKAIFSAFMGKDKTPSQNIALLSELKKAYEVEQEHLQFKENWINQFGSAQGADTAWRGYKKVSPIIIPTEDGSGVMINPKRIPWSGLNLSELEKLGRGEMKAVEGANDKIPNLTGESYERKTGPSEKKYRIYDKETKKELIVSKSELGKYGL